MHPVFEPDLNRLPIRSLRRNMPNRVPLHRFRIYALRQDLRNPCPLALAQLRRGVDGISQKVLTNTLRGLERDGILTRRIYASVPPKVEYSLTPLGRSLCGLVAGICDWSEANIDQVQIARVAYDLALHESSVSQ